MEVLLELNQRRETWCRVEGTPQQDWDRTQRRHYQGHLRTSPVLLTALTTGPQCRTADRCRLPPAKLPERRHYEESYESHLV